MPIVDNQKWAKGIVRPIIVALTLLGLLSCSDNPNYVDMHGNGPNENANVTQKSDTDRWYKHTNVKNGESVYQKHCKICHGENAVGAFNWRKKHPDGSWPPPPLNGSAHAWHHDLNFLRSKIANGASSSSERMPAFKGTLDEKEIDDVIAYFQSLWNDEIYDIWFESD